MNDYASETLAMLEARDGRLVIRDGSQRLRFRSVVRRAGHWLRWLAWRVVVRCRGGMTTSRYDDRVWVASYKGEGDRTRFQLRVWFGDR